MRIFAFSLAAALMMLQYRLWISDQGVHEVSRLKEALATQLADNQTQVERNRQLAAEVTDLKEGMSALEERARSELGMIGNGETFYQVVTPATSVPADSAAADAPTAPRAGAHAPITARAE
jgi:cell division protein FtsB